MAEVKVKDSGFKEVEIFGKADKDEKGNIKSEYPAFYFPTQKNELKERVNSTKRQLEEGMIEPSVKIEVVAALERDMETLSKIEESEPRLTDLARDQLSKAVKETESGLKPTMYTRNAEHKGLVDAHEVASMMTEPCIKIKNEFQEMLASKCNVKMHNGFVTQEGANKMWKIGRRLLGENSNIEVLRKD